MDFHNTYFSALNSTLNSSFTETIKNRTILMHVSRDIPHEVLKQKSELGNLISGKNSDFVLESTTQKPGQQKTVLFLLTIVLLLFLNVVLALAVKYFRNALKKSQNMYFFIMHENLKKSQEIEELNNCISLLDHSILTKNKVILELENKIHDLNDIILCPQKIKFLQDEKTVYLDQLKSKIILTEDDWLTFKNIFLTLYPTFITTLLKINPSLTNAEIRMATLLKLKYSNTEISRKLGISPNSVRRTNLRLRNKMEVKDQDHLMTTLLKLN
jgi:DNA-binding CsgD family transcriptional regulator